MIDLDRLLVLLGVGAVWIICSIGYSRMLRASATLLFGAAAACGNPTGPPGARCSGTLDAASYPDASTSFPTAENSSNICPAMPVVLTGGASAGDPCTSNTDCAPSCCACASSGNTALVAWCVQGVCTTADEACCAFEAYPSAAVCQPGQ